MSNVTNPCSIRRGSLPHVREAAAPQTCESGRLVRRQVGRKSQLHSARDPSAKLRVIADPERRDVK